MAKKNACTFKEWVAVTVLILVLGLFSTATAQSISANNSTDQFPLRAFYPSVKTIDTETLLQIYDDAVIIDVRSQFEFDVVRINKAKSLPLSAAGFINALEPERSSHAQIPLIFYCNDPSCARAFRAALLAQSTGYINVFAYDAGVFSLLDVAPEKITLMQTTPAQPARVITPQQYQKAQLDFTAFKERNSLLNAQIIDIRDLYRRDLEPRLEGIRNIPLESFLNAVTNRIWTEKKLLIFDQNGEQTRLLQYFLQANGYPDYAFLQGGVQALNDEEIRQNLTSTSSEVSLNQQRLLQLIQNQRLQPLDIEVIMLLLGSVSFENHVVIERPLALEKLQCTASQLELAATRLQTSGYLLFNQSRETLVFHLNPQLAWKGKMSGELWSSRVKEFDAAAVR